jgi:outer membrane protein TolC
MRREAARRAIAGAESDLLPQLDLGITVGSNGFNFDTTFGRYISAYRDNATPMNFSASVSWALPVQNSQARSSILMNEAEHERLTIQEQDVRRQIQLNCSLALQRLQRAYARQMISAKSVRLAEEVYEDEQVRVKAGKSTLTQLRVRQDYVIAAQRELYSVRRDYALAVVQIRFLASMFFKEDGATVSTTDSSLFDLSELIQ